MYHFSMAANHNIKFGDAGYVRGGSLVGGEEGHERLGVGLEVVLLSAMVRMSSY